MRQLHGHLPMALSLTPKALKSTSEPSEELKGAHSGHLTVVSIDFGMSSCSMSYRINNADPVESVELTYAACSAIPTVLLLRKLDGHNCRLVGIGLDAYASLSPDDLSNYHFFDLNRLFHSHQVSAALEQT